MNKVAAGKTILVCVSVSNPNLPDSDHDGRNDGEDRNPHIYYALATYSHSDAVQYANEWAYLNGLYEFGRYNFTTDYNHDFPFYESSDCANFISQCVFAGGMPMNELWHAYANDGFVFTNWDVTLTWSRVQEQYDYFVASDYCLREVIITSQDIEAGRLPTIIAQYDIQAGDMLIMDAYSDGSMNHSTIISSVDTNMIYYAAHSESRLDKPLEDALGGDVDTYIFHVLQLRG